MPSLPGLWLSLSFIIGIYAAGNFDIPVMISCALIALVLLLVLINKFLHLIPNKYSFFCLIFLFFFLGSLRIGIKLHTLKTDESSLICKRREMYVQGKVIGPSVSSPGYSTAIIQINKFIDENPAWQEANLKTSIRFSEKTKLQYGEIITLKGAFHISQRDDEKPFNSYLMQKNIDCKTFYPQLLSRRPSQLPSLMGLLFSIKNGAHKILQKIIPFPESELLAGILLGIESRIPQYLKQAFTLTGTSHIVAISGFNIALIANSVKKIFDRLFNYRLSACISIMTIGIYTLMIGPQPAVVRASLMGILIIPADLIGRKTVGFNSLALSAAIMALINPFVIWSLSFQLSFCATFGIMMFNNYFNHYLIKALRKTRLPSKRFLFSFLQESFITTVSAQIATLPILIKNFRIFYPISLLVNFLILPLQSWIMILGGFALFSGFLSLSLGRILGFFVYLLAAFNNRIVMFFSLFSNEINLGAGYFFWASILGIGFLSYLAIKDQKTCPYEFESIDALL